MSCVKSCTGSCRGKPVPGRTAPLLRPGMDPPPRSWVGGSRRPRREARWHPGRLSDLASGCRGKPWRKAPRGCIRTCRHTFPRPPARRANQRRDKLILLIGRLNHFYPNLMNVIELRPGNDLIPVQVSGVASVPAPWAPQCGRSR